MYFCKKKNRINMYTNNQEKIQLLGHFSEFYAYMEKYEDKNMKDLILQGQNFCYFTKLIWTLTLV